MTLCTVHYLPYTDRSGKTWAPYHDTQTHMGIFIHWDATHRVYFDRWDENYYVGSTPSFSFHQCDFDLTKNPVPGCRGPGNVIGNGNIAVGAASVTVTMNWVTPAPANLNLAKGVTTCSYTK